jgi:di/tripeptidase
VDRTATPYSAKDITLSLDIGDSTLRKWCLALEENGYIFYRTDQNKRLFTEKDIIVLRHFQQLVKEKNMSMNNASLIVTARFQKESFSDETDVEQIEKEMNIVPSNRSDNEMVLALQEQQSQLVNEMVTMREQQSQLVELAMGMAKELHARRQESDELRNRLQQIQNEVQKANENVSEQKNLLIEQKNDAKEREINRDSLLMESLRETQELKKLILEAKEEQAKKPARKGILSWFSRD